MFTRHFAAALIAAGAFTITACGDDDRETVFQPTNIPAVVITPGSTTLRVGGTQQLTAEVRDGSSGQPINGAAVTWASADTLIAKVSDAGLVTVVGPGTAGITAKYNSSIGVAAITVIGPVTAVTVTSSASTLSVGSTAQLTTSAVDASGVPQAREITYTSSAPTVATVSSTGLVSAVGAGTTSITATSEGKSGSVNLTVTAPIPVLVTPASTFLAGGGTQQLTVVLRDPVTGAVLTSPVTYTTSDATIATVSATGLVSMVGGGTATITATGNGRSATATVSNLLTSGTTSTIAGAASFVGTYYVNVPANASRLVFTTTSATAPDVDIQAFGPTGSTALCTSDGPDANETCTVNGPLAAGLYRVRVTSFANGAYTGVGLRATVTP